jgi:VWFA-related protein
MAENRTSVAQSLSISSVRGFLAACLSVALLLLLQSRGSAQTSGQSPVDGNSMTFKVTKRLVTLDVVVTDKKGNQVNNLGKEDFLVIEDKTPQMIESFELPSAHAMPPGQATIVNSSADLPKIGQSPVTILVLDEMNTRFEDSAYAREALRHYLQRQPTVLAQPTILLVASDKKFDVIHDYTEDRDALLEALKKHFPALPARMMRGGQSGPDAGERIAISLGALAQIAQASGGTPGRKNVIWVGCGFPSMSTPELADPKMDAINAAIKTTTQKLLQSRVTLNIIDPTPMSTSDVDFSDADIVTPDMLENAVDENGSELFPGDIQFATFAPATGGSIFRLRNDVDREIATSINNGNNYYTLTYSPTNKSDDAAQYRQIRIVMKKPGLTATTRTGYYPEVKPETGAPIKPPTTHELAFDLVERNGIGSYLLHADPQTLYWRRESNGKYVAEVTLMQVYFSAKNKVIYHKPFEFSSTSDGDPAHMINQQTTFVVPVTIPPGTSRIRLVVRDVVSGKMGTIDIAHP